MAAMEPLVDFGIWVMNSRLMEDTVEAANCLKRLNESGLRGMLDFAVEFASDNDVCDRNFHGFLSTVEAAKSLPPSTVSSVVVKITAICALNLLERVSDLLSQKTRIINPEEEKHLLGQQRLLKLCQACVEANVPLVIDAEHSTVQPAIDYLTYSSAIKYNKDINLLCMEQFKPT
ncbi:hypothetical protein GH714_032191 [Hevea brasiliensis]|uniref:Proline dehydrogenase n=1 Tax=Hevea brasiliensis TaxID=3981 RepID=A0A6A6MJK0_HEVBR|nr:hypothetical protein GH714_032191 [Hevea brasiliensis]